MFSRRKARWVLAAVLVVAVVGVGGYFVRKNLIAAQACAAVRTTPGPIVHTRTGTEKVTILGDSYSSGDTLPSRHDAWPYQLPAASDWDVSMNAVGGTGFTNPGACGDAAFSTRIPTVLATKPQMLLVQGGLNDFGARPADLERAANAFLDRVKSVPHVVLVGPTDAPARSAGARTVDEVLARVAAAHHVEYVSTFGWRDQFNAEGLHLTAAGQRDYAAQLAAAIR